MQWSIGVSTTASNS